MTKKIFFILALISILCTNVGAQTDVEVNKSGRPIRIVCIGNSITYGAGLKDRKTESYPTQLQTLLGPGFEVLNFGVSGRTALNTDRAYTATSAYTKALQTNPDVVTIKLGTNDSNSRYSQLAADSFIIHYTSIIRSFQQLPSHPRIIILLPVASYRKKTEQQTDSAISNVIVPKIREVAYKEKLEIIDLHSITLGADSLFPDRLHPNSTVMTTIANRLKEVLTMEQDTKYDISKKLTKAKKQFNYYGYDGYKFTFKGHNATVVKPRFTAAGRPWIWRARFWNQEPQTEIALLDRGYHVVYCDVAELLGNNEAIKIWNKFYDFLTNAGLSKKAVMEGMSRGGAYVYNWAAKNPEKVACVYADAPVLDFRSWPGGKGKGKASASTWKIFKEDYGLKTEEEAMNFNGNPLDKVADIVRGNYPMLHVVGDADEVVPVEENTTLFEQKVKELGGNIQVIHKPGGKHHPHSLPNPQPIVDFILKSIAECNKN